MKRRLIDCWRILTGRYENYFLIEISDSELKKVTEPKQNWELDIHTHGVSAAQFYFILMGILSGMNEEMAENE